MATAIDSSRHLPSNQKPANFLYFGGLKLDQQVAQFLIDINTQVNLEIARIGNILIISGSDEALNPFKDTQATFLVDSIIEFKGFLLNNGATIIRDLKEVPTGVNMTVKHLDGNIVEYVEHKKIVWPYFVNLNNVHM